MVELLVAIQRLVMMSLTNLYLEVNMNYGLTDTQINEIIVKWGKDSYLKIMQEIKIYSEKWKLSDFSYMKYFSFNAIFSCKSKFYGCCVLKIYSKDSEYNTLREYGGGRFVKVFECENNVMLMERIIPGTMLKNEPSLEKRLAVFLELFQGLHIESKNPEIYVSYTKWICNRIKYMNTREDCKELYAYMLEAKNIYLEMLAVYNKNLLLHGDFHYANILLDNEGQYKIVDPFGYIGDPIFEFGRNMTMEYYKGGTENKFEIIIKAIEYFERNLMIPNKIFKQCFYIDLVTNKCERVQAGDTADLADAKFAESILNAK